MIHSVKVTNHRNESVTMELRNPEKSGFLIQSIEGLGTGPADINMTDIAGSDGAKFDSSRVPPRNILMTLGLMENPDVETMRQLSYKYFPIKRQIKLTFYLSNRISEIYGYVESNEPSIFNSQESTSISILCPDPYFYDVNDQHTLFSSITSLFEFPFENNHATNKLIEFSSVVFETIKNIYYLGDAEIGVLFHIHAIGAATGLVFIDTLTLREIALNDTKLIALTGSGIVAGDDIFISTVKGNKFVSLLRSGVYTNILNALEPYPYWFQIDKGDNLIAYNADSGLLNLQFEIINRVAYEGI